MASPPLRLLRSSVMDLERYLKRPEQKFHQAFSIVIDRIGAAIEQMDAEGISSNELLFNRNFCAATHYYLQRLRNSYAKDNIDLLAWTTRNLFELTVKLKYYRSRPDGIDVFLLERDVDHIELHAGLLEWIKATHPDPDSPAMQALANIRNAKIERHQAATATDRSGDGREGRDAAGVRRVL